MDRLLEIQKDIKKLYHENPDERAGGWLFDSHVKIVADYSKQIAKTAKADQEVCALAALLHDIARVKGIWDDPEGGKTKHMTELYKRKFGREPKHVLFNAWGYDAVHLIADAAKGCKDSVCIKDNLYKVKNFEGASARITINENGSSPMLESVFQIRNGSFVLVKA